MKLSRFDKLCLGFVVAGFVCLFVGLAAAQVTLPQVQRVDPVADLIQVIPRGVPTSGNQYATVEQVNQDGLQSPVPLTAFSLQFNNGTSYFIIRPAGTLATGTFTFDPNAGNGQRACIQSTQTQTAVVVAPGTNQTIAGTPVTAMVAGTTYCWKYVYGAATWYPITI